MTTSGRTPPSIAALAVICVLTLLGCENAGVSSGNGNGGGSTDDGELPTLETDHDDTVTLVEGGPPVDIEFTLSSAPASETVYSFEIDAPENVVYDRSRLTFTPIATTGTLRLQAADDRFDSGRERISLVVSDPTGATALEVEVAYSENDTARVTASAPEVAVVRGGQGVELGLVLDTEPSAPVQLSLQVADAGPIQTEPAQLTFDGSNWDTEQVVTVTANQDGQKRFGRETTLTVESSSDDPVYGGSAPTAVSVTTYPELKRLLSQPGSHNLYVSVQDTRIAFVDRNSSPVVVVYEYDAASGKFSKLGSDFSYSTYDGDEHALGPNGLAISDVSEDTTTLYQWDGSTWDQAYTHTVVASDRILGVETIGNLLIVTYYDESYFGVGGNVSEVLQIDSGSLLSKDIAERWYVRSRFSSYGNYALLRARCSWPGCAEQSADLYGVDAEDSWQELDVWSVDNDDRVSQVYADEQDNYALVVDTNGMRRLDLTDVESASFPELGSYSMEAGMFGDFVEVGGEPAYMDNYGTFHVYSPEGDAFEVRVDMAAIIAANGGLEHDYRLFNVGETVFIEHGSGIYRIGQ